jgi:hypothetical protein
MVARHVRSLKLDTYYRDRGADSAKPDRRILWHNSPINDRPSSLVAITTKRASVLVCRDWCPNSDSTTPQRNRSEPRMFHERGGRRSRRAI